MRPPRQISLFDGPAARLGAAGRAVKLALNRAAGASGLSREEIIHRAENLAQEAGANLCPGGGLGIGTLHKWLDVNAAGHMPSLLGLIALCQILDDAEALAPALEALGLEIMGPEDRKYRDLGRAAWEMKALRKRIKKLEEET